jgi:hypothetical protein
MDPMIFEELFNEYFAVLELEQASFDKIVNQYTCVLDSLFSDNIFNRTRFYVADYFAVYIANRISHVDSYYLLQALREILDEKWLSSSST